MTTPLTAPGSATYNIAEAAALTGLHRNTIRLRIKLGQLEAEVRDGRFGAEYRIPHAALVRASLIDGALDALDGPDLGEEPTVPAAAEEESGEDFTPSHRTQDLPAALTSLSDLFQRHEQAMFRLGFLQSELERVKALAENAESTREERETTRAEAERLRSELDDARARLLEADAERAELEGARARLRDAEDLRRMLTAMEGETARLRAAVEAAAQRRPWWRSWGRTTSTAAAPVEKAA